MSVRFGVDDRRQVTRLAEGLERRRSWEGRTDLLVEVVTLAGDDPAPNLVARVDDGAMGRGTRVGVRLSIRLGVRFGVRRWDDVGFPNGGGCVHDLGRMVRWERPRFGVGFTAAGYEKERKEPECPPNSVGTFVGMEEPIWRYLG